MLIYHLWDFLEVVPITPVPWCLSCLSSFFLPLISFLFGFKLLWKDIFINRAVFDSWFQRDSLAPSTFEETSNGSPNGSSPWPYNLNWSFNYPFLSHKNHSTTSFTIILSRFYLLFSFCIMWVIQKWKNEI